MFAKIKKKFEKTKNVDKVLHGMDLTNYSSINSMNIIKATSCLDSYKSPLFYRRKLNQKWNQLENVFFEVFIVSSIPKKY